MRFRDITPPGRSLALGLILLTAACAATPQPATAPGPGAPTPAPESVMNSFNGRYNGVATPDTTTPGCGGAPRSIRIQVNNDHIWVHTHHPSRKLSGTVGADGAISMQGNDSYHRLTGSILNGVLTATETITKAPKKLRGFYTEGGTDCTTAIQATRVSPGGAGTDSDPANDSD